MKVPNSEQTTLYKENEDLYKRMNKSIERKIVSKEKEIKDLDTLYDKKIEQARQAGEEDFIQSLDRNQQRIIGESNNFEEKIKGYQDQLKKTQNSVAKEEATLKEAEKGKLENLKTQLEDNFQDQYSNTQLNQREMHESTQQAIKEIALKSKSEKLLMEGNAQYEINALSSNLNQKAADNEKNFRGKINSDIRLHTAEITRQKTELQKLMTLDAEKNKRLNSEQNRVSKEQLDFQNKYQQSMLVQRDTDFKVRYENMVKEHDTILKGLSKSFEDDVKKIVDKTSGEKRILESRQSDPFYKVDTLNPKLVEDLKDVTVTLPVAEYEKENVHLSTQGRTIKITLSRKYTDGMTSEDGSINRSTRSELYSKELNTTDLLSAKSIKQSYQDGVLTFKINKA